jgi:hypothetical protein
VRANWRKATALLFATAALAGALSAPAMGSRYHQCNSGGGNGFESTSTNDCDPGNSGGNNNGGG